MEEMKNGKCTVCGYIYTISISPLACPQCGAAGEEDMTAQKDVGAKEVEMQDNSETSTGAAGEDIAEKTEVAENADMEEPNRQTKNQNADAAEQKKKDKQ